MPKARHLRHERAIALDFLVNSIIFPPTREFSGANAERDLDRATSPSTRLSRPNQTPQSLIGLAADDVSFLRDSTLFFVDRTTERSQLINDRLPGAAPGPI